MTTYKSKGVPVPEPTDQNDPPAYVGALADWVNDRPGIQSMTTAQRNALTGQNLWPGRVIFNTTTQQHEANVTGTTGAAYWDAVGTIGAWQDVVPTLQDRGGVNGAHRDRSWGNSAIYFQRRLVRGTWQVKGWVSLGSTCDLVLGGSNFIGMASIRFPDIPTSTIATFGAWYNPRRTNAGMTEAYGQARQLSDNLRELIAPPGAAPIYDSLTWYREDTFSRNALWGVAADSPWDWGPGDVIAIQSGFLA